MQHNKTSVAFKVRKLVRYATLFGPITTFVKAKAQLHSGKTLGFEGDVWRNPKCSNPESPDRFVGVVGAGNFLFNTAFYLKGAKPNFLQATYDLLPSRSRSLCEAYNGAYAAANFETLLNDDKIKLVYIASNHASHAEYAIRCLDAGKHVHIEKPHVVTRDQLERLDAAQKRNPDCMVFLGFNRPRSEIFRRIRSALETAAGPLMVNWFIAGHEIPDDHWYFSEAEGGRILGNLCHWTDLTLEMVGLENAFPCVINAVSAPEAKSDFSVSIVFADKSVAGITFSAKGHTFEGVREVLNAHRGDVLITMSDFQHLRIDSGHRRLRYKGLFRDHGHRSNIVNSLTAIASLDRSKAASRSYVRATAELFLAVKEAADSGQPVTVTAQQVADR
ncbi:Gfo/Idh/MocA family oxidoreductase [Tardiphaga sp.]|uniref:Gfo/Idh/MocA family protein n=1 Tax=Tardiphaga sp. TaxID=1926292 RepID=UPI00262B1CA4|nr:Gfo/Idh/MocA family oxidoreductase [Tardiphaga sp.]MDB5618898.1 gfo/Idh/MocA family oxidoreductase [Tardiphaga sp.]